MAWYSAEPEERWEAGGEWLLIRPIRPADAAEHDAFFHRLSPEDIRLRFFAAVRELTSAQLDKFTRLRRGKQGERRASIWMRKCRRVRDGGRA